jgi:hypothetical protein
MKIYPKLGSLTYNRFAAMRRQGLNKLSVITKPLLLYRCGYSQLIFNQMEKCKWSFFKFNHYYQYTEKKVFQIIGKNKEEQWAVKFRVSFNWL